MFLYEYVNSGYIMSTCNDILRYSPFALTFQLPVNVDQHLSILLV